MGDYGYEVAAVKATRVASDDIDKTFRSGYIGKWFNWQAYFPRGGMLIGLVLIPLVPRVG